MENNIEQNDVAHNTVRFDVLNGNDNTNNKNIIDNYVNNDSALNKQNSGNYSTNDNFDTSKYTLVDHLDEDTTIKGQEWSVFSFLSPEGIMNCDIRAFKFRGAFGTEEAAKEYAAKLEQTDKYFKIFVGESFKWVEFNPPEHKVGKVLTSDKHQQQILESQAKHRMEKMNMLAGKYKENIDKHDKGKEERIKETKKASAAQTAVDEHNKKMKNVYEQETAKNPTIKRNSYDVNIIKDRLRMKKLKSDEEKLKSYTGIEATTKDTNEKTKLVSSIEQNVEKQKSELKSVEANIENIKKLIEQRKNNNN